MVQHTDGRRTNHAPLADSDDELVEAVRFLGETATPPRPFDDAHPTMTLALGDLPTLPGEADGGVLTPAVALGAPYAERLRQHGVTLEVTKLG